MEWAKKNVRSECGVDRLGVGRGGGGGGGRGGGEGVHAPTICGLKKLLLNLRDLSQLY